jgi:DNA-binding PadR family transcriptional regulator
LPTTHPERNPTNYLLSSDHLFYSLKEMVDSLTNSELLVLLAVLRLGNKTYGVPIVEELERNRSRIGVATVYVILGRLEGRGLVASAIGEATPERGGRAKRYFRVTAKGVRRVRSIQRTLSQLWQGLPQFEEGTT